MREAFARFSRRPIHPEMRGQELDTVPVKPRTVRRLHRVVREKLGDESDGRIATENNVYAIRKSSSLSGGNVLAVEQHPVGEDGTASLYTSVAENKRRRPHVTIRRLEVTDPGSDTDEAFAGALAAAQKSRAEMAEITGLPQVSEGDIRRMIQNIQTGRQEPIE